MLAWLERELKASRGFWRVAVFHHIRPTPMATTQPIRAWSAPAHC